MKKSVLLYIICLLTLALSANAQELTVKSFEHATNDISALVSERRDLNDKPCALIKVGLAVQGAQFQGNVMGDVERKVGEYWLYMTQGSRMVRLMHDNYLPLKVTFADYGIEKLESGATYELMILLPNNAVANNTIPSNPQASSTQVSSTQQALPQPQQMQSQQVKETETFTVNGVSFDMIYVQGGTFTMGATPEQGSDAYNAEKPVHQVTLSNYYIGKMEVTQDLWQAIMDYNPSDFEGSNHPVERVTWKDCQKFINKLNKLTGMAFRLPTEAEWEYAARGGNKSRGYKYSGSDNIDDVAWYDSNSEMTTHPVALNDANELGIYDMSGNVWELCQDWYGNYNSSSQIDPIGPTNGSNRVIRGGSWGYSSGLCRISNRGRFTPESHNYNIGFRLALSE